MPLRRSYQKHSFQKKYTRITCEKCGAGKLLTYKGNSPHIPRCPKCGNNPMRAS